MAMTDVNRTIEAVWRIESARLIAGIARLVHDVGLAEDLAPEALVAALEQWPESGVPDNPGAWLMATGKHRAIVSSTCATSRAEKPSTSRSRRTARCPAGRCCSAAMKASSTLSRCS